MMGEHIMPATVETTQQTSACCAQSSSCCLKPEARDDGDSVRDMVRSTYGKAVKDVLRKGQEPTPGSSKGMALTGVDPITRDLYSQTEANEVPSDALLASFGCGNPTALAHLHPGEIVLDLGSGGGIDVLLSARRVGPQGKAYGLDMTPEMLEVARRNQKMARVENVEFIQGTVEAIPLPDSSVDVIISNCVINLSPDKDRTLREAYRVLRPGGRLAVSDIVLRRPLPASTNKSIRLWAGCVAGALVEEEYRRKLHDAGFVDVSIEPTRIYSRQDAEEIAKDAAACCGGDAESQLQALDGAVMSAFVRALKAL